MNLEKSRQKGKVDNIFEKGNNKIKNNELILTEIKYYYKQLYTESDVVPMGSMLSFTAKFGLKLNPYL